MAHFKRSERGAAAVEFALVVPLIVLVLLAIVEGGTRYSHQTEINNAAFRAARSASVSATTTAAAAASAAYTDAHTTTSNIAKCPGDGTTPDITITIQATKSSPSGFFGSYTLKGKATTRCEP